MPKEPLHTTAVVKYSLTKLCLRLESCSYLEVSTVNSEKTLELAVGSWDSRPDLLCKKPRENSTGVLNVTAPRI